MELFFQQELLEAGVDEAGRGCLAGPVVAAAVILPHGFDISGINDSKQLTARQREIAAAFIKENALAWAIAEASPEEIDQINILQASFLAMRRALELLNPQPQLILVDGNRFSGYGYIPYQCIVKGDAKIASIAAASILAKTHRDAVMRQWHEQFPVYGWNRNAGYPTAEHRRAIQETGVTFLHRRSYGPVLLALNNLSPDC